MDLSGLLSLALLALFSLLHIGPLSLAICDLAVDCAGPVATSPVFNDGLRLSFEVWSSKSLLVSFREISI